MCVPCHCWKLVLILALPLILIYRQIFQFCIFKQIVLHVYTLSGPKLVQVVQLYLKLTQVSSSRFTSCAIDKDRYRFSLQLQRQLESWRLIWAHVNSVTVHGVSTFECRYKWACTYQLAIVVLAVAAVLNVVQVVAGLLTKKTQTLGASHVELLLATYLI